MSLACSWCVVGVSLRVLNVSLVCFWCVLGVTLVCSWCVLGVSLVCSWCVPDVSLVSFLGVFLVCPWRICGVFLVCSRVFTPSGRYMCIFSRVHVLCCARCVCIFVSPMDIIFHVSSWCKQACCSCLGVCLTCRREYCVTFVPKILLYASLVFQQCFHVNVYLICVSFALTALG